MNLPKHINEVISFLSEVERARGRWDNQLELKRAQLQVALDSGDTKEIEKARFETIECFAASMDSYISLNRKLTELKSKVGKL